MPIRPPGEAPPDREKLEAWASDRLAAAADAYAERGEAAFAKPRNAALEAAAEAVRAGRGKGAAEMVPPPAAQATQRPRQGPRARM
jgi:hypothetical protein